MQPAAGPAQPASLHLLLVLLSVSLCCVNQKVKYSAGELLGMTDGTLTKTLLTFMIKSVAGTYRDKVQCSAKSANLS